MLVDTLLVDNFKLKNCEEDDDDEDVMTARAAVRANENEELNKWIGKIDSDLKRFLEKHDTANKDLTRILKAGGVDSMESIATLYKDGREFMQEVEEIGLNIPFAVHGPIGKLFKTLNANYCNRSNGMCIY